MATTSCGHRAVALATLLLGLAAVSPPAAAPALERSVALRGGGGWQSPQPGTPPQRWDIDVTRRGEGVIEGRVTLQGSPLLRSGALRGAIEGRRVTGDILDDAGNHVATFIGRLLPAGGWRGTYQDRSGEIGRWTWDGGLAQ
jgi:hypothetical protein